MWATPVVCELPVPVSEGVPVGMMKLSRSARRRRRAWRTAARFAYRHSDGDLQETLRADGSCIRSARRRRRAWRTAARFAYCHSGYLQEALRADGICIGLRTGTAMTVLRQQSEAHESDDLLGKMPIEGSSDRPEEPAEGDPGKITALSAVLNEGEEATAVCDSAAHQFTAPRSVSSEGEIWEEPVEGDVDEIAACLAVFSEGVQRKMPAASDPQDQSESTPAGRYPGGGDAAAPAPVLPLDVEDKPPRIILFQGTTMTLFEDEMRYPFGCTYMGMVPRAVWKQRDQDPEANVITDDDFGYLHHVGTEVALRAKPGADEAGITKLVLAALCRFEVELSRKGYAGYWHEVREEKEREFIACIEEITTRM